MKQTVGYTYGADASCADGAPVNNFLKRKRREAAYGKRAAKYTHSSETLYFNDYWVWHIDSATRSRGGKVTKNIYLGTERLASRIGSYNTYYGEEKESTFFYHSDHLGSAQLVTDCDGNEYQRLEYTPYGETWMDLKAETSLILKLPYKFSAKELDEETGLYYYGARYLDPRMSRWISADPAMNTGEYFSNPDAGMGGIYNHVNFNLYHYAGNNPINYTDPDGRNTIPYGVAVSKGRILPLNQSEFGNLLYNRRTNCYAYAFNLLKNPLTKENFLTGGFLDPIYIYKFLRNFFTEKKFLTDRTFALQPGMLCNRMNELDTAKTMDDYCNKLVELVTADAAAIGYTFKPTTLDGDVTPGNWKVAIVAGTVFDSKTGKNKNVYHFYRLEKTGTWSQKPGKNIPIWVDSNGKCIRDPQKAERRISFGEYTKFLGYYEVGEN